MFLNLIVEYGINFKLQFLTKGGEEGIVGEEEIWKPSPWEGIHTSTTTTAEKMIMTHNTSTMMACNRNQAAISQTKATESENRR